VYVNDPDSREARFVGHVRRGMNGEWFPEMPSHHTRKLAARDLVQATLAMDWYAEQLGGSRVPGN
jgi:hypothetical protein